jgi:predicted nuclease of predicted toxin-antitoxin system
VRYLVDEDIPADVALIARNLGLDSVSVHEIHRRGFSDEEQLEFATAEGRIVVTRNRNDFLRLVMAAFQAGLPSPGALVVSRSLPNTHPAAIAHTLKRWHDFQSESGDPGLCIFDFL